MTARPPQVAHPAAAYPTPGYPPAAYPGAVYPRAGYQTGVHPAAAQPASIGRRVGAYAIDTAIAYVIALVAIGVVMAVMSATGLTSDPARVLVAVGLAYLGIGAGLLAWWLVYSAMQGGRGSLGQRALGLRLQDASSPAPIGFWRAVLRNVVWGLAGSIVVGYFTPLFDSSGRRQGWHDLAARAIVIDGRATAPTVPAAPASASVPASLAANPYVATVPPMPPLPVPAPGRAAFSAPQAAAPITGMISSVPGVAHAHEPAHHTYASGALATTTTAPLPPASTTEPLEALLAREAAAAAAPAAVSAPAGIAAPAMPVEDDLESTRLNGPGVPLPAERAALYPEAPVITVLTWDDGTRMAVYGRSLYGRNPAAEDGAVAISVRDETLSLSKTHFEIGGDAHGAWVADRHSTNGTLLVRDGGRIPLAPGVATGLRAGDRLEFGDRSARVGSA